MEGGGGLRGPVVEGGGGQSVRQEEIPGAEGVEENFSLGYIGSAAVLCYTVWSNPPPPLGGTGLTLGEGGVTKGGG